MYKSEEARRLHRTKQLKRMWFEAFIYVTFGCGVAAICFLLAFGY